MLSELGSLAPDRVIAWFMYCDDLGMWRWARTDNQGVTRASHEGFSTGMLCFRDLKRYGWNMDGGSGLGAELAAGKPMMPRASSACLALPRARFAAYPKD